MPPLLSLSNRLTSFGSRPLPGDAIDPDAAAFVEATGATDVAGVDGWVRGLKGMGIYDDMVCWPLRSAQNFGTGTTVQSLGGWLQRSGTMINGPTWSTAGQVFAPASSQRIEFGATQIFQQGDDYTIFAVGEVREVTGAGGTAVAMGNNRGTALSNWRDGETRFRVTSWREDETSPGAVLFGGPVTERRMVSAAADNNSVRYFDNADFQTSSNGDYRVSPTATRESIGCLILPNDIVVSLYDGTISIGGYFRRKLTDAQVADLYALYKATLGVGLGLP